MISVSYAAQEGGAAIKIVGRVRAAGHPVTLRSSAAARPVALATDPPPGRARRTGSRRSGPSRGQLIDLLRARAAPTRDRGRALGWLSRR